MTDLERLDDRIAALLLPARPVRGHKGTFGKLLVLAGSLDYAGAALLVCRAAGRAGAGLVTLAVPESLQPLFAAKVVEATTMPLVEDDVEEVDPEPALARILDHDHDALVIGPGLRPSLATGELVRGVLGPAGGEDACPAVVDAEALRTLAAEDGWWEGVRRPSVLTPHAGEFARLRAASGISPGADGDLNDGRRGARATLPSMPPPPGATWSCSRAPTRSSPPRTGRVRSRRSRTRASRPAGPATSWPGPSGRCSPRVSRRTPQRASASTSTAWPARPSGPGWATRGSSPATCPWRWRSRDGGWPATRHVEPATGRVGFGSRDGAGPGRDAR